MFYFKHISKLHITNYRYYTKFTGLTGGQIIYNKLLEHNVSKSWIYSGGAIMPLIDTFYKGQINYYINSHEQNSTHSATAYARSTGNTGIVICTSGPGLTNCVTGMLDATNDSTPLIVISGQVPLTTIGTDAFQECPATDITKSITKWNYCVKTVEELPYVIDKAFHIANDGKKGTVHIDLPKCISSGKFQGTTIKEFSVNPKINDNLITDDYITEIANFINNAERPVLYVGQGCNDSSNELITLMKKSNIPVTTTIHAMGCVDESHPLSLQFLGMHGYPAANHAIQNSDCIIALGSRFDDRTIGNLKYYAPIAIKKGGIIHCDIAAKQINKILRTNFPVKLDCKEFINRLLPHMKTIERTEWHKTINNWKVKYPITFPTYKDKSINTQMVIKEIDNQTPDKENYYISTGVGNHQMYTAQFIKWKYPKRFISSGSLGVMGFGLPASIGIQIGHPDKKVINIDGDGSFNMTMSDLKTIKRYNLPIKIAVMNNETLGMVRIWESCFFDQRYVATDNPNNPNYVKLAESFRIKGIYCDNENDLKEKIQEFLEFDGPILCEFKVKHEMCLPLVKPGSGLDDMVLTDKNIDMDDVLPPS